MNASPGRPPMTSPVILVAHRGHAAEWPENTLPALESAVDAGAPWVEVDVQVTADGVPVLLHDADLARVAGRPDSIFELDAATLNSIAAGEPARLGDRFPAARIPTLAAFAAWLRERPAVRAFVELKHESLARWGRAPVLAACREALAPAAGQWAFISYDYEVLALARGFGEPEVGWVVRGFDAAIAAQARELPARWLFCNHERLPSGPLPAGPWDWVLYEVADAAMARALVARGAGWLETMDMETLRGALLED